MFYSQFILAKKGPLGTIWIAAHLERKLRKNQVADTDIGVSVDSILSPDVPIALRLSSHLLLGVVRIYSRKVNYLFNDCSEALLKIKQAFRSTVVDLPPEESTAPYHSITLPETFDLDDFELPDSDFQGNYTDHHISTREQITLQDSVEGPSYTTLQFGLDERFGDGDSSQMRLVLDEDLFMGNVPSPRYVQLGTEDGTGHEGQSSNAHTNMDIDKGNNGSGEHMNSHIPNLSEVLSNDCDKPVLSSVEKLRMGGDSSELHGYNIPTPDLNQSFPPDYHTFTTENVQSSSLFDHAQAPATPGLLEEAIRADVQEIPGLSPQEKTVSSSAMEVINTDNSALQLELEVSPAVNTIDCLNDMTMVHVPEHNSHSLSPLNSLLSEAKPVSLGPECSGGFSVSHEAHLQCGEITDDHLQGEFVHKTKPVSPSSKCLDGLLVAPNVTHLECEQKSIDQIPSGFVFNDGSNLPLMHDGMEAVHSEVTHLDYPVTSSHSFQASKLDTSNKSVADEVVVSSHDNVWVQGVTPETNSASLQNSADPSIPSNEQTGDINSCVTRKTPGLSSDLYLRPCNLPMNLVNIVPSEAVNINKVTASILGNQNHVNNGDSRLISNAPVFSSGLHLQPCSLPLNQVNILSAEAGSLVENTSANSHSVPTFISDTPLVKQPPHVNASLVENAPAYPHSLPTYISDTPLVQPLHIDSTLVENAPASSCNVPTYISDTLLVKQPPPYVSLVEKIPASQNVPTYISDTPMVKQPLHVNASSVQNTPALSHNVSTYISDTPMVKQPLHVNASSVQNTLSHNVSTYISDTPLVNQPLHVNVSLVENTPAHSHNGPTYISDTPLVKQPPHVNASFFNLPGEGNLAVNTTNSFQETHQRSNSLLSSFLSDGSKQSNQLISVFPEKTQRVDPNSLSSTGYPEPEKMLLASTFDFNLPNGSGRVIAEKGVSQSPKNIGPISNLSGNKDYSMDSSMILNNSKTHDQMTSLFSKESQLGNSNCFSSSICPEPEKLLLASSLDVNFPNDSGRVIAEKGVSQSAKNISPFSNLSGNKDYSINSSKILNYSKTHDQMTSLFSKESHLGNSNCFSSSRCPEPEKVLFASSCDVIQSNYQGQITAVKGVSESAESISQSSSLSGKKRPLTDNSTVLQNSNSLRRSSLPRAKKNTPYMPDDDDLLASILVGRAPTLRMGPSPPLPKAASRKRPRLTPRVGVPKRKVLIDDTMVLHADAIRKQLVNIEDIRRLRKKAPCTRPEIWMIQKNLMEEELFSESLFSGISTELNDMYTRRYDMNDNRNSPIVDHHISEFDLYVESSKEERPRMEFVSRSSERETGDRTTAMPDRLDNGVLGSSGAPVSIPTDTGKEAVEPPVQDKLGHHVSQLEPSSNNQTITMSTGIVHERAGVESSIIRAPHSGNELEVSTVSRIEKEFVPKKIEVTVVVQEQESLHDSFQHFDRPREMADRTMNFVGAAVNDVTSADEEARCRIIDTKMQEPPGTFVSVEVPKCTEAARFDVASAGDEARCRIIDTEMQEPPGTSISVEVPKCTETPGLEVQEKFEHNISQLGPSSNSQTIAVSTGNVRETMVDLSLISSSRSGPEFAISTVSICEEEGKNTLHEPSSNNRIIAVSTGNVCGTVVVQPFVSSLCSGPELAISTVATCEEEAKNTLPEPSSNNQTIAVSTGNVCETVVVQPLISSSRSGPELAISTVSKNTPHELSSNNQTIAVSTGNVRETVVVQSSNNQTIAVSTGSVRETVVVQPLISSPCFGPEIAISTVSTREEEAKNTLHEASSDNQTIAVSTGNIRETVADLPLISDHELAISTVSTREEVKNTLHEPELIHDLPRPSERPIEMFDRPSKFDGTAVDNVPTTEYIDRGNFVRTGEASITDDAYFSQKNGRMDSVDLSGPQYGHIVGEIENGEILVSMLDKCLSEDGAGLPADSPNVNKHANDPIPETAGKIDEPVEVATISGFHAMEEIENELAVAVRGEHVMMKIDEPTSEVFRSENPQAVNPFLHQHNTETENVLSAVGDNSGLLECIVEGSLDGESAPMDTGAARESGQLNNGVEVNLLDNDTAFLNADYEADFGEAAGNDIPDSEASLENSGWSTRTRGVARFLKTLFDAEHGRGKKIVPVDHLLAGKTRKEASRMFFETLVLKTRDYIHVEQEVPFESIKIKPRPKLLKSEF